MIYYALLSGNWRERASKRRNQTVALQYSQTSWTKWKTDRLFSWYPDLTWNSDDRLAIHDQSEFQGNVLNKSFPWQRDHATIAWTVVNYFYKFRLDFHAVYVQVNFLVEHCVIFNDNEVKQIRENKPTNTQPI